jgi:adenosylcobinamide-GDP ribazoletransferase
MISIIAAFQFLTICPTLIQRMFKSEEMGRAVGWFPLVGLVLGLSLYGVYRLTSYIFPVSMVAALTVAAWVILTRAFHLDGLMDTCDGLFGGWTPERRLEIMKDSRMGAFGTLGGGLVLLLQFSALSNLHFSLAFPALLLATTLGRWASPLVIYSFPYAREDGLGSAMKQNVTWREVALATAITVLTVGWVGGWVGLIVICGAAAVGWLTALYALRLLPGLTGDIYGTITTLVETLTLVAFTALPPNWVQPIWP